MTTDPETKQLKPAVLAALQETYLRVQTLENAQRLWDRVLSDDEKRQLRVDFEACYREFGTAGMWAEVRHVSAERALIEVALQTGFLNEPTARWLLREVGDEPPQPSKPFWNVSTGELRLGDNVIRQLRRVAKRPTNIQKILDAFQSQRWPARIDNPMFRGGHYTPDESQLRDAVYSLNNGLKKIRFHAREGGRAVTWKRV